MPRPSATHPSDDDAERRVSRRGVLKSGGSLAALLAIGSLPVFTASARAATPRPAVPALIPAGQATTLWYPAPAAEASILQQGLPIGNGRIGALVGGDPSHDFLYLTDCSMWTGGLNATLGSDGQFPYGSADFGTFGLLAKAYLSIPAHTIGKLTGYRRQLDLSNGIVSADYQFQQVGYHREVYASHPDDVVVVHLTQSGGGSYTGSLALNGTRGETGSADQASRTVSFAGSLANGLAYGAVVTAASATGTVTVSGSTVSFTGCEEVLIVITGGTNYSTNAATGFKDGTVDPRAVARTRAGTAAGLTGDALLATHVADHQALFGRMAVNLGSSGTAQRAMDTASRLTARAAAGSAPDPELDASYLQFGRYLMVAGSRTGLPLNLQGLWLDRNNPDWMSDYHTDINVQMNYWLPDRAGLSDCFQAFADYCLHQVPSWQQQTTSLFNDSRNGFRNSSGKIAGWTTAISTNVYGGLGWWWHPAGNAWICNSLYEHYQYTQDSAYLQKIYPLLKGACQFWEARLITTTVTDPATGTPRTVLVDDNDWSPEQGPTDAHGITYAQELVWQLFQNYRAAGAALGLDPAYVSTVTGLQNQLYLPQVSSTTGWLEEWMTDADLGDPTHRHLSPLIGLFPGDRITADGSPAALLTGVRNLLTARGMQSFGWACAWRALCWARLKDGEKAYQLVSTVMAPSVNFSNGAAPNMFDMYSFGSRSTFQIDANFGTPSAMIEMLVHSRPGLVELLPALPAAWSANGTVTGIGVRGGFTVDLTWRSGAVTSATLHSVGGTGTTVRAGGWSQTVTLAPGGSVTLTPTAAPTPTVCRLVNRASGKVLDVPGSSTATGTALIQYTDHNSANQQWRLNPVGGGPVNLVNVNSGLLADVQGGSTGNGVPVIQWSDGHSTNQQWTLSDAGSGYVKIVNVRSGSLLSVAGGSLVDGAAIVQQADSGATSQHWRVVAVG
jgi:alpha-L-fucosidase 2